MPEHDLGSDPRQGKANGTGQIVSRRGIDLHPWIQMGHGKLNFQAEIKKSNPKIDDIKEALKSMGYKADEIKSVVPLLEANINEPVQVLIKLALKHFIK